MKPVNTIAAALLVTAALFTSMLPAVADTFSKEDDAGVRKLIADFDRSWNTHDMELLATLYRVDSVDTDLLGIWRRGRDAIVKAHAVLDQTIFKDCKVKTDSIEIRETGPDYASAVVIDYIDGYTTPSGQAIPPSELKTVYIMTKGSDGWKIYHSGACTQTPQAAKHDPANAAPK